MVLTSAKETVDWWYRWLTSKPRRSPVHAQVLITGKCNARCVQCNIWSRYQENPELADDELSTEELLELADQLEDLCVKTVSISGGEPFMRKDLFRFVRALKEKKIWVNVTTNGSMLNEVNRKAVIETHLDSLTVSIDGTEEVHSRLRKGLSFQKTYSDLKELASLSKAIGDGKPCLNVASVVTGENVESIIELNKTITQESLGINHSFGSLISFAEQFGVTREGGRIHGLEVDDAQMDWLMAHLPEEKDRFAYRMMRKYNAGETSYPSLFHPCLAGLFNIVISEMGDVLPCCTWSEGGVVGNIRARPISQIWLSPEFREKRRQIRKGHCPGCWISTYVENSLPVWPESIVKRLGKKVGFGNRSLYSS